MFKAIIKVTLKKKILDPQGKAIESSLHNLGFSSLSAVRTGKNIDITVNANDIEDAKKSIQLACQKLLANPVTEEYEYEIFDQNGSVADRFSTHQIQAQVTAGEEAIR